MATTRAVMRDARTMVRRISQRLRTASAVTASTLTRARQQLQQMQPLVTRILDQTRARLLGGDTHVPDKVLSVFEPHTEAIRKGKIAKPTEFGKLVTIQESEHQIITAYQVHERRPPDMTLWTPALDWHIALFDRPPDIAAGDRGFASAAMKRPRSPAASDASSCRGPGGKHRRDAHLNASDGFAADSGGASGAKAASV
jgi:IS5 family transposase